MVTALEYRLHPVSEVLTGALVYPPGQTPELLQAYVKFMRAAPDEMNGLAQIFPSEHGPHSLCWSTIAVNLALGTIY